MANNKNPREVKIGAGQAKPVTAQGKKTSAANKTAAGKKASAAKKTAAAKKTPRSKPVQKTEKSTADTHILEETPPFYSAEGKRVAIVVGGSSGIGYHTALGLCREGYSVYNLSRTDSEPGYIRNICADATDKDEIGRAIQSVFAREGRVDVLVYSAGWSLAAPLEHVSEDDLRTLFETNYFGLIKALWAVIPIMRAQRDGRIIAVSSIGGTSPIPFDAPYSASKAAVDLTLRALAVELKPFNVLVTSVQPGGVRTRFTFKRKVYETNEVGEYAFSMDRAVKKLNQAEQEGMNPADVADAIIDTIQEKRPPLTKAIGFKNKSVKFAHKILPSALTDLMNRISYDQ
ncbi:MAG: SDR family NAD(P)-dependent oxidoreductase [Firmicutes bacterium]|nr:SDR family NAD(P)-dependent oxidoreductase [Bacillota bacterium]